MKTMKKLLAAVLATVMLLGVTACGNKNDTPAADGDNTGTTSTTVLKMGHVYSETYPMHLAMLAMADEVYEKTEGRYKIEIYANSSLGNESDLNEGVNIGTVDMAFTATTPLAKARRIFKWIDENFPWASAREYSTIDNIPEYVLANNHGDCGQVTLLFLTLCRSVGIPAHFQSGFMLHPGDENLHDWGEIYIQDLGWVPVDMSFGIPAYAQNEKETFFFLGGIDSFRMVVNNDFGCPLYPAKQYPRSETVDFQRGEVEWQGGNLYFDKWKWNLEVLERTDL